MHYEHVRKTFKEKAHGFIQSNPKKKDKYLYLGKLTEYIDYCDNMHDFFIQMHENLPKESPSRQNSNMNYIKKQTTIGGDDQRGSAFANMKKLPTPKTEAHHKLLMSENSIIREKAEKDKRVSNSKRVSQHRGSLKSRKNTNELKSIDTTDEFDELKSLSKGQDGSLIKVGESL